LQFLASPEAAHTLQEAEELPGGLKSAKIVDLLQALHHTNDAQCRMSDSEVMTTSIVAMLYFGGNFEYSLSENCRQATGLFR
jgi:hypothetical protein